VDFRFATEVRVRFAETDAQGVAHHAVYLVWFEVARIDYLARFRGGYPELRAEGIEALTTEAHVSYLAPARFDDRLAEGWSHHACVDAVTHRPTRVPAWLLEEIASAES